MQSVATPTDSFADTPVPDGAAVMAHHGNWRFVESAPERVAATEMWLSVSVAQLPDGSIDSSGANFDPPYVWIDEDYEGKRL